MSDAPPPIGWTVSTQDWRSRPPGSAAKPPKTTRRWFATREAAEAHKRHERELNPQPEYLVCVSPARFKPGRPKTIAKPAHHGLMDWD
jgi:hypothetical protein